MNQAMTQLLARAADGDAAAADRLMPSVYDQLRSLAEDLLSRERTDHTLQATALVHEAYLKLVDQRSARVRDRAHFFALAAQAMRRILVDHARTHKRIKRGAGRKVSLETELVVAFEQSVDLVALDEALHSLSAANADAARVVELRYFGGLTIAEAALALGASESTVEREWRYARAWLYRAMSDPQPGGTAEHVG